MKCKEMKIDWSCGIGLWVGGCEEAVGTARLSSASSVFRQKPDLLISQSPLHHDDDRHLIFPAIHLTYIATCSANTSNKLNTHIYDRSNLLASTTCE